jgi:hypothetical protein
MEGDRKMTLYQGFFNWKGETHEEWVRAYSKGQAFRLLTARLSVTLNTTAFTVRQYFTQKANSDEIKEVKEDGNNKG